MPAFVTFPLTFDMRFFLLLAWLGLLPDWATAQDSTLTRLIRQNRYAFEPAGPDRFAGPGWERLQAEIGRSQFVLLGEDHGLAEIPALAQAVAEVLKPAAFVAEISPYEAQDLNRLAAAPGLPTAFQQQYPFSLSFYNWTEEFRLVQALHARGVPVLGLDQLYAGNAGHLVAQMADQARDPQVRAALRRRATAYLAHDRRNLYGPTVLGPSLMSTLPPIAVDSLVALAAHESPAVQAMARALADSHAIYRASAARTALPTGLMAHQTRVNGMKQELLQQLRPYEQGPNHQLPRLLFKFGCNHLGRDRAILSNIADVGSLAANLADAQGQPSLHLMVMGKQGIQNVRDSFDHAANLGPLAPQDNPFLLPFFDQTPAGPWQLFDLRPARKALATHRLLVANPQLERTLLSYDYLVVIPQVTAAGNF